VNGDDGVKVPARFFLGMGAFIAASAAVYWLTSYEDAGTTMLAVAASFGLFCAVYLWRQSRRAEDADDGADAPPEPWFPHSSVWPFAIGVAGFFLANGLIIGSWFLVPGVILLVGGVVGYAAESRSRV
jgi:predicted membrane channel-forming protein YqfA (hemolysin III family)